MLNITIPNNNIAERKYILGIIFNEFLGLDYELIIDNGELNIKDWIIKLNDDKKFIIKDTFFSKFPKDLEYLKTENIPKSIKELDIFAACFFMLTRWEEYVNKARDSHDRFPATESLAFKQGFLDRPIVNEYVEKLKQMLLELDDSLNFKEHSFKQYISCDVDEPFDCTVENIGNLVKVCVGDILKRKSLLLALKRVRRYIYNKLDNYKYDENYTFEWYMDVCEKAGVKASFYFIPDSSEKGNGCYSLEDTKIQNLLRYIDNRGHEIGTHGSYQTYQDKEKTKAQKQKLENLLKVLNISQTIKGNRQHYLRWDSAITPSVLDYAGFEYDSTGGYADMVGFMYGVCYEFSMFDLLNRKKLKLKQRPLIVMECSLIDDTYMGYGYTEKTLNTINSLKEQCKKYNGNFTLLWHNNHFNSKDDKKLFKRVVV